jgi:polysaccharide pyruvyl transferase CsaB
MKVLHLSGGGEIGGAKSHILVLVSELGKFCEVKLISFRNSSFYEEALQMGIDTEAIHTGDIFKDVRRLVSIIRDGHYDIVHSHGAKANMMSVLARRRTPFISVSTVHSDYRHDYMHSLIKKYTFGVINRLALYSIDNYVAVTSVFKTMLVERGFKPSKIHTIYNGIDFDVPVPAFSKREFHAKYNIPEIEDEVYVCIVARLHPVKDVGTFIRGASEVLKVNPKVRFLIMGADVGERTSLEALAESLGISGHVHFLGQVDSPYEVLQNIDINALTSLSESFPYVILEGARMSKPIVSSNVGGLPALISPMETGMFFEPGDYKMFAAHILKLASDKALRERMGANIYAKALENFSIKSMCRTQLGIYNRIIKMRGLAAASRKSYDVAISGYYGYKNSGDDAILMAIVNNLHAVDEDLRIIVLSATPIDTSLLLDVDSIQRFAMFKVAKAVRASKLLIYGGGNLLQDDTSTRSLMYYLSILWMAHFERTLTMLFASGIGPISSRFNKYLSKKVVNQVDFITLRENFSYHELEMLGVTKPRIEVTADPVMTIPTNQLSSPNSILIIENIPLEGRYAAISLRDWSISGQFETIIAQSADYLYEKYGLSTIFINMQHPDDVKVSERVCGKMKHIGYVVNGKHPVAGMLGLVGRCEILIGMRLHSLIYAASLSVPMIALPYEPKVDAFLALMEMQEFSVGGLNRLTSDAMCDLIDTIMNNRDTLIPRIEETFNIIKRKANRNVEIVYELLNDGGVKDVSR